MISICDKCTYRGRPSYKYPCCDCHGEIGSYLCRFKPEPLPTNYDVIRGMSPGQLADFLCGIANCEVCPARCNCESTPNPFLKWLQTQQVKGDLHE